MNIKSLACIAVLSFSSLAYGIDESVTAAIKSSNIDSLKGLLMPGSYVRLQDKKVYSSLAQQKTKDAFMRLQAASFSDIKRGMVGLFKAGAAAFCFKEFYESLNSDKVYVTAKGEDGSGTLFEELRDSVACQAKVAPKEALFNLKNILQQNYERFFMSALAVYLGCKSWGDFSAVLHKDQRYTNYIRALAVESLVARVPVFEQ